MAKIIWRPLTNDGQSSVEGKQRKIVAMDKAEKDDNLEVKVEGAWFAAEVSLREDGMTNIRYDGYIDEEEQWDAEKIKSLEPIHEHIRVVSEQLQDEDCGIVSVNMIVCALRKAQDKDEDREGWFDAIVTEVRKRLHTVGRGSVGEICTCSFTVIWIDGPYKGQTERNLACEHICVPSTKDVQTHPIVLDILRCARGKGKGSDPGEEARRSWATTSSSSKEKKRRRDTEDDYTRSPEKKVDIRRFKRLKSKKGFSQVNSGEIFSHPDPSVQRLESVDGHFSSPSTEKRDRLKWKARQRTVRQFNPDEIAADPDSDHLDQKLELVTYHPDCTSTEMGEIQDGISLTSSSALSDMGLSSHAAELIREMGSDLCARRDPLSQSKQLTNATKIRFVTSLSAHSSEDNNRPKEKMRGQVESESSVPSGLSALRERILGTKSTNRDCKDQVELKDTIVQNAKSWDSFCESQVGQKIATFPTVEPLTERLAKTKVATDDTRDAKCEFQVKKEIKADSLEERHGMNCRSSEVQMKNENMETDSREEHHLSSKPSDEGGEILGSSKLPFDFKIKDREAEPSPFLEQNRVEVFSSTFQEKNVKKVKVEINLKQAAEIQSAKSDPSTLSVDADMKEREEKADLTLNPKRADFFSTACEEHMAKAEDLFKQQRAEYLAAKSEAPWLKKLRITVEFDVENECVSIVEGVSLNKVLPGAKVTSLSSNCEEKEKNSSVQPEFEEDESKVRTYFRRTRPSTEEVGCSKSDTKLGSVAKNVILLSDEEEEECVIVGSSISPTPPARDEQQNGWIVHFQSNQARSKRSMFVMNVLTKSGCILTIDNLEVGVRESHLRELLLKFCGKEKMQSVTIPPHPSMNRSMGYVIFVDKEAADAAAGVLARCIIVSARGRPWVVKRQGQEEPGFDTKSDLTEDYQDVNITSSEKFKVLTEKQQPEYNTARKRLRVFEEHQKQFRVMSHRHDNEEKQLDANPTLSLYD